MAQQSTVVEAYAPFDIVYYAGRAKLPYGLTFHPTGEVVAEYLRTKEAAVRIASELCARELEDIDEKTAEPHGVTLCTACQKRRGVSLCKKCFDALYHPAKEGGPSNA